MSQQKQLEMKIDGAQGRTENVCCLISAIAVDMTSSSIAIGLISTKRQVFPLSFLFALNLN